MKFPVETFRSIQLWLAIAALTLAPLFFGSVDQLWVAIWAVLLSISTLIGVAGPLGAAQRGVLFAFLAALALAATSTVSYGAELFVSNPVQGTIGKYDAAVIDMEDARPHIVKRADHPAIRVVPEWLGAGTLRRRELHEAALQRSRFWSWISARMARRSYCGSQSG